MADPRTRERIIELIRDMRQRTVANGCTPGEAAKFAVKCAEWIERYAIDQAELRAKHDSSAEEIEVCQNLLRTGKKVFNPGWNQVVSGLARGVCCQVILLHRSGEAVYGIVGDTLDADYVCQMATSVIPALLITANLEGIEHGYEKAGLIRWSNQYLMGAGIEIQRRLEAERKVRSDAKKAASTCTSLVVTGETLAVEKRAATATVFKQMYPQTKETRSRCEYNDVAFSRGRDAGKRVGLHIGIE